MSVFDETKRCCRAVGDGALDVVEIVRVHVGAKQLDMILVRAEVVAGLHLADAVPLAQVEIDLDPHVRHRARRR